MSGSNLFSFCFIFLHLPLKICNFFISTSFISSFFRESFSQINNKKPCSLCFPPASPFLYYHTAPLRLGWKQAAFALQCHLVAGKWVLFPSYWNCTSTMVIRFPLLLCTTQLLPSQVVKFFKNVRFMFLI